ncbi:MAG TPA: GMC family oxidoreductase [Steroidobacteraceae bacterium]|jgi:choline dehydrogenase-like flavoprotein|nr:GMC family oxidoreductase [Steroidobacteraceae bacterium]
MPFVTASTQRGPYDVIIVGSGAGGGQAAYTLCMEGARVLMLEAGRRYTPATESPMFQTPDMAPLGGADTPDKNKGFYDATIGGWDVPGQPYVSVPDQWGGYFTWWRARMLGGRTNHWGRISLRNGPYDFKPRSRDGLGLDWPIGYDDVAPYYDKVELLIGVYGGDTSLENTPAGPGDTLLPPPKPIVSDHLLMKRAPRLGIPVLPGRRAVLTRAQDHRTIPGKLHPGNPRAQKVLAEAMKKRSPCLWATPCGRGCAVAANYQSTTVHIPPALATGNLDIITDAMVYEVSMGKNGRANGVRFVDATTGRHEHVTGRVVVLGASAYESARILLNSKSGQYPNGLANSSGLVGRYILDTVGSSVSAQIPLLESLPPLNDDAADGLQVYVPWWLYKENLSHKLPFPRGYHIEYGGGKQMPSVGTFAGLEWLTGGSYGRQFKEDARRYYGSFVYFAGRGAMVPNDNSYVEIDPKVKDRFGIPVLRIHWQWGDYEQRQAVHMQQTFGALTEAMGGRVTSPIVTDPVKAVSPGGYMIHEVGGTVMGADARSSVTNRWSQTWDVPNLFVADGGVFPYNADKNPTLTIMALAWRMSDHILDRMRRREI